MKIDYKKNWDNETGTCYRQTITIDKETMEKFNNYIMNKKIEVDNNFFKTHLYSENDLKIKSIDYLEEGINYTNLIHLRLFMIFAINNLEKENLKRILYRNTIIKVI